jgi:predicted Zn finger-like uncharacterized protein
MILTCPSCSASYNVPNEAIGVDGRTVRCKKCKHEWFQAGEKKALEDLMHIIESTDFDVDEIAFDDNKKKAKNKAAKKDRVKLTVRLSALAEKVIPARLKNYLFSGPKRSFLSHFASFMVALATFMCLILVLVSARWTITKVIPPLAPVYEAAGFPLMNYARINPEKALIIDRVTLQTAGDKREIIGSLINLTSQTIKVPEFKLTYLDEHETALHEEIHSLPVMVIEKEHSYSFNIPVADNAPKTFSAVKITFAEKQ